MAKNQGKSENGITDVVPVGTSAVAAPDYQQFVETVTADWLEGIKIERIVTLDNGQGVRGEFLGVGPTVEVSDPVTGEVRDLPTWRIEVKKDIVIRLLDSSQLGREFKTMTVGTRVRVIKLGQVDTRKGRRVNDFIVAPETPAAHA